MIKDRCLNQLRSRILPEIILNRSGSLNPFALPLASELTTELLGPDGEPSLRVIILQTKRSHSMIKIHIRRRVSEDHQNALLSLINQLRATIVGHPGYLSSETLKRIDQPGEILVVSKWQSRFYWNQWYESRERVGVQDEIDRLPAAQTQYEIYEYD